MNSFTLKYNSQWRYQKSKHKVILFACFFTWDFRIKFIKGIMKSKGVSDCHRFLSCFNLHTPKQFFCTTAKDCNRIGRITHNSIDATLSTFGYIISTLFTLTPTLISTLKCSPPFLPRNSHHKQQTFTPGNDMDIKPCSDFHCGF
jgi:hypothetical protein